MKPTGSYGATAETQHAKKSECLVHTKKAKQQKTWETNVLPQCKVCVCVVCVFVCLLQLLALHVHWLRLPFEQFFRYNVFFQHFCCFWFCCILSISSCMPHAMCNSAQASGTLLTSHLRLSLHAALLLR